MMITSTIFRRIGLLGQKDRNELDWAPEHNIATIDSSLVSVEFCVLANVKDDAQRCNLRIRYVIIPGSVLTFVAVSILRTTFCCLKDKYCGFIDYV